LRGRVAVLACPTEVAAGAAFRATVLVENTGPRSWRALAAPRPPQWLAPDHPGHASDPTALFLDGGTSAEANAAAVSAYRRFIERHWLEGAVTLGVHLEGPQSDSARHDFARALLPHDAKPGARVQVDVPMTAPVVPGEYALTFELVSELVRWFGTGRDEGTVRLTVL
jgi:hypothetical protein